MKSNHQNGAGASGEHKQTPDGSPRKIRVLPHWNALLMLVAIKVGIGTSWLLVAVEAVFLLAFTIAILTRRRVSPVTLKISSLILLGIVTLTLMVGIGHLISTLKSDVNGVKLIYSGLLLYGFNVLVSALWYWEVDGGV